MRFPLRAAAAVCVLSLVGAKGAVPEPKPKTASAYATLEAARDSVVAMVARTVTLPPRQISAAPCRFGYWYLPDSAAGYVVRVPLKEGPECRADLLGEALTRAGWTPDYHYSADGTDGTMMGYRRNNYLCVVEGRWNGGDDMDTTWVVTSCELIVTCVPSREGDQPK
jgi:hypothetical protein